MSASSGSADERPDEAGRGSRSSEESRLQLRGADLASREFHDETIVLDLRGSRYLATNATGSVLWGMLQRGATREQMIAALLSRFDVDRGRAVQDVDAFVEECRRRDLLAF